MRRIAVLLVPLLLSGCLIGPDYERPPPATPTTQAYKETADSVFRPCRDTIDRGRWWNIYGDGVDQLRQVDVSNQNLKASEAAYRQAVALIRQSQSALYPTIGYTGSAQQQSGRTGSTTSTVSFGNSTAQYALGGTLTWEIDVWGNIRRQIESDSAAAQASYATLAAARLSAQSSLVTNYYSLRISDERKRLLEASVAAFARAMEIVRNQMNAGTVSQLNFAQAQAQYEQTRAQLVAEAANRAQFEHAIAALIGKAPAEFNLPPEKIADTVPTVEAGVPSALLERRPDIASAERSMAAANAQIGVAQGAYYPQFTLNASINFASTALSTRRSPTPSGRSARNSPVRWSMARAAQVEGAGPTTTRRWRPTGPSSLPAVEDALAQQRVFGSASVQRTVGASRDAERRSTSTAPER
jgi:NodT family efflux transporter outer membrane factor (OMF) lipoprotein